LSTDNRLIAIVGPTASGKTPLAMALAGRIGGEIINADSRQTYRGMDIGTAKPSTADRERVRHHLIDVADPDEAFSLARYLDVAHDTLDHCWSRGVPPLLVGGTGQYVWALIEGWRVPRVPPDKQLRAELEQLLAREGVDALARELERVDPATARDIDTKNPRRLIRAIEVFRVTGRPLSEWRAAQPPAFASTIIGLSCERAELYRRIDARVDAMISSGFLDEVRGLIDRGYACDLPSMSSIGYRQLCQHFAGELSLDDAIARIKTETHRLARMQHNWFRANDSRIRWIDVTTSDPLDAALRVVESNDGHLL
jgi:tRNA dimethylallyltransferase